MYVIVCVYNCLCVLSRLHMLSELEHAFTELQRECPRTGGGAGSGARESKLDLMVNWDARLLMTQNSFRAKEPVLALRRALLSLSKGSEYTPIYSAPDLVY